jgi:hypothetical protein
MPLSGSPHVWRESYTATAVVALVFRFCECRAPRSDSQTSWRSLLHAKYAVLTCARPLGDTFAIAHSFDASSS